MSNKGKVFNFIQFSEINENLNEDDAIQTPTPDAAPLPEPSADGAAGAEPAPDATGQEGAEPAEGGEGQGGPEILKVYTDSEEDIQELKDAGIDLTGENEEGADAGEGAEGAEGQEGAEPAEGGEGVTENEDAPEDAEPVEGGADATGADAGEGAESGEGAEGESEIPADVLYIKIRTEDGEEVILPFKEESEENRQPVEGEENTFDTELVATHNDYEFRVTAEIKVNPTTGEEEKPEVQEGEPVEEQPAEDGGVEGGEGGPAAPAEGNEQGAQPDAAPNEAFAFEQKIMSFTQFVNEGKREEENFKKAQQWKKALKDGKKKKKK